MVTIVIALCLFALLSSPSVAGYSKSWRDEEDTGLDLLPKHFPEEGYYGYAIVNTKRSNEMLFGDNFAPQLNPFVIHAKAKRDDDTPMRLCGMKLVSTVVEICAGCTKPSGMTLVGKRACNASPSFNQFLTHCLPALGTLVKRSQPISDMCCKDMCSKTQIKENFCC
uniref:Saposin B-type domain-containing protein n=1 Tax=Steinernema glaseri TaxID=37863 RepID=A0A1I8A518_9BILA